MGRFARRAHHAAAPAGRWRSADVPAPMRMVAIGAVAVLGLALHSDLPAAASRFMNKSAAGQVRGGPAMVFRPAAVYRREVIPADVGQSSAAASPASAQTTA